MIKRFIYRSIVTAIIMFFYLPAMIQAEGTNPQMILANIQKSNRDNRQYTAVKLDNGITVLLISDKQASKSMAALALPVGSLQDPLKQQGLAHYLEHMVLMGSQNYPEPDSFSQYLKKNAGSYNASTAAYRTAYFFDVENSAFDEAVDRLADAIAHPLFDKHNADKERNAVNAELTMARSRDGMRIAQIDSETINPQHPSTKFFGGNLETLQDKEGSQLHDELLAFYQRYYSANLMVAVLYSDQPLDKLKTLAENTFGKIANHQRQVEPITVDAITDNEKGIIIHYQPVKPFKMINLQFPIRDNLDDFRNKTDNYVSYLIENRSKNTVADWLQKQGLIESIYAYADPIRFGNSGIFSINISLTDKGLKQRETIIAALFNYINLLKEKGVQKSYFDEMADLLNLSFQYPDIRRDMRYVEWLTDILLQYPVEHVLDAEYIADQFDPEAISARLADLTLQNSRIWFISPDEPTNKTAYFLQAPYQVDKLSAQQSQQILAATDLPEFSLPMYNRYIPTDFSLLNKPLTHEQKPQVVLNETSLLASYLPSFYFADEPKIRLMLSLRNSAVLDNARQQVLFNLVDYLVKKALYDLEYQAFVAGMNYTIYSNQGMMINLSGFSQYLPELLMAILTEYRTFTVDDVQLQQAKSWYQQQLDMADKVTAYELALQPIEAISNLNYTARNTRRELVDSITLNELINYRDQLFKQMSVSLLATGNITASQVKALAQKVKSLIGTTQTTLLPIKTVKVNKAESIAFIQQSHSSDFALAAVYLPLNEDEVHFRAAGLTLSNIIGTWFFDQLRSKEQLGYLVTSFITKIGDQSALAFLVQSNIKDPAYLYQRYQDFYQQAAKRLRQLTTDEIEQFKRGVISQLTETPKTLDEELENYYSDFVKTNTQFNSRDKLIEQVQQITASTLLEYYQKTVLNKTDHLVIFSQVMANESEKKGVIQLPDLQIYSDAENVQSTLSVTEINRQ